MPHYFKRISSVLHKVGEHLVNKITTVDGTAEKKQKNFSRSNIFATILQNDHNRCGFPSIIAKMRIPHVESRVLLRSSRIRHSHRWGGNSRNPKS